MKRITDHSGFFDSDEDFVLRLLKEWIPSSFAVSEKEQEQQLFARLKNCLPEVQMVAQYGIARGKADIVIQESHLIELKLGFQNVDELDRCLGQLERYRQKWVAKDCGPVYLVVVGESDVEFRHILHEWFNHIGGTFHLIEKQPSLQSV